MGAEHTSKFGCGEEHDVRVIYEC